MLTRFIRFASNNALVAGLLSTVVGGWLLAKLLTLTASDLGGVLGALGAWLRSPEVVPRVNLIGLVLLAFLLGLLVTVALYVKHYAQLARSQVAAAPKVEPKPAPAPEPESAVPADFNPTKRQLAAAAVLGRAFPDRGDLQGIYAVMMRDDYSLHQLGVTRAEVASDLEVLAAAHVVRIDALTENFAYYHLTKPGRAWLNERTARQRGRPASRPSDY